MPYARQLLTNLRKQALTDIQSASFNSGGTALLQNSILRILATVEAGLTYELYAFLDWISLQCVPFTATNEYLSGWANLRGIYRLDATAATGAVALTGVATTDVPAGTLVARTDGVQYTTNADWQVGSNATNFITAVVPGAAGNADSGIALTVASPIPGITSAGSAAGAIVGGADQELDGPFRLRMLAAYAASPAGGDANDYIGWATAVPGCTRAWAVPQLSGPGSVGVYVMFDVSEAANGGFPIGANGGATAETRIAAATGDLLLVANALYPVRPVTALVKVIAPTANTIDFTIQSLSTNNTIVEGNIVAALQDCFLRLGSPLGTPVYPSDINAAIESVPSVARYSLISPVTPITVSLGQLPVVGNVAFI